jgi:hypothetical protein
MTMRRTYFLGAVVALVGCSGGDQYALYRNSVLDATSDSASRILIASFDAPESGSYNFSNCQLAAQLFQDQPGVKTKFWCEKK